MSARLRFSLVISGRGNGPRKQIPGPSDSYRRYWLISPRRPIATKIWGYAHTRWQYEKCRSRNISCYQSDLDWVKGWGQPKERDLCGGEEETMHLFDQSCFLNQCPTSFRSLHFPLHRKNNKDMAASIECIFVCVCAEAVEGFLTRGFDKLIFTAL